MLTVYIVAIVGLAALVTWAVIKIFPTERTPKKPDKPCVAITPSGANALDKR